MPTGAPALAWLYAIAARRLADYQRRGAVERRMQRALAMERVPLSEQDAEMIRLLGDDAASRHARELPRDQRDAVAAHVVDDAAIPSSPGAGHPSRPRCASASRAVWRRCGGGEEGGRERLPHRAAARGRQRSRAHRASPRAAPARRLRAWRPVLTGAVALAALLSSRSSPSARSPSAEPTARAARDQGAADRRHPGDGVLACGVAVGGRLRALRGRAHRPLDTPPGGGADPAPGIVPRTSPPATEACGCAGKRDMDDGHLVRIDPRSNRIVAIRRDGHGRHARRRRRLALGDRRQPEPMGLDRGSPRAPAPVTRKTRSAGHRTRCRRGGVASGSQRTARVARTRRGSGEILHRLAAARRQRPDTATPPTALAADAARFWLPRAGEGRLFRLEGEHGDADARGSTSRSRAVQHAVLAVTRDALWVVVQRRAPRARPRQSVSIRDSGKVTASVHLGTR